jgi:divalent metal cation (Fe/Co/Zn/Cd) transporter
LKIFDLEHVNGVLDLKLRVSGPNLFLEAQLSVEDHISVIHAHEITKSIRNLAETYFPDYNVECIIEMNPLGSETTIWENITNLMYSMKTEFPEIQNMKNLNIIRIIDKTFLSLTIVVDDLLTLGEAHGYSTKFENELMKQAKTITRVITHIEGSRTVDNIISKQLACDPMEPEKMKQLKEEIEEILKAHSYVKGYHGLECWTSPDNCFIEIHIFFDGLLNIAKVHDYTSELEKEIQNLKIDNLQEVIIHAEPVEGRSDGVIFNL